MTVATVQRHDSLRAGSIMRLEDGTSLEIRSARPADREGLVRAFEKLSSRSRYRRFFAHKRSLSEADLRFLEELDGDGQGALVALAGDHGNEIVGVAHYVRATDDARAAEMAITVVDAWQGRGIGRRLLAALLEAAARRGVRRVRVELLAENIPMRRLLEDIFGPYGLERDGAVFSGEFPVPAPAERAPDRAGPLFDLLRLAATEAVLPLKFGLRLSRKRLAALRRRLHA